MYTVSIQAGGQSTRMGTNKALLNFDGHPLIVRILRRVERLSTDVMITTNEPDLFSFLSVPVFQDILPDSGALGGLVTAFHYARYDIVAIVACDMPFVLPELIAAEVEMMQRMDVDVVIPRTRYGLEPLLAVYRVHRCLPAALEALRAGKRRIISWFSSVRVHELAEEEVAMIDPLRLSFVNVNTPAEYEHAVALTRQKPGE
jgi:molybdopterin-guanine dinucleotide biosynthesis protein A